MSTQTKSSSRPWLVFIGCCVLSLVGFGLIVNTPGLYFTVLGETLNVSRTQIALASSIMAIAGAVTMLFAGKVMKMLDSRILISVCIAGVAALFLAQSFFNAVWQFYISFALMGILYVIPISLAPSVLLANWFESKLGMVMGIALGLSGIGGTIFNPVVSWFITNLGWQTSYRLTALILVICILPFSLLVFKFRPDEAKGEQAYGLSSPLPSPMTPRPPASCPASNPRRPTAPRRSCCWCSSPCSCRLWPRWSSTSPAMKSPMA